MRINRPGGRAGLLGAALVTAIAVAGLVGPASAAPPATPSPTSTPGSVAEAQKQKAAADKALADLDRRIEIETAQVHDLSAAADRAREQYVAQVLVQQDAARQERAAIAAQQQAQADYDTARRKFVQMITYTFQYGDSPATYEAAALFTATRPSDVLNTLELAQIADRNQTVVVAAMTTALAQKKAAEQASRDLLAQEQTTTARLAADQRDAEQTMAAAQRALATLRHDIAAAKKSQLSAVIALSQFLGGWSMADPAHAAALNARYRKIAAKAASVPLPANPGHWTPALGRYVANRAMAWIGTPYAWAGGNAAGPTRGVCAGDGAQNDCKIVGFDCSGLALYGWAPFEALQHLASAQYGVGTVHPAIAALQPGDLVFWSNGPSVAGIHHVAIYVGDGNVVQAPQSGDIVRITPLGSVDAGYFGATRPMS